MTAISGSRSVEFTSRELVLLTTLLLALIGTAAAKDHKHTKPTNTPHVVAHLQFDGMSELDMTIQTRPGDKYYLYVQHSKEEGVSIIDISKPEKPRAIGVLHDGDAAGDARMTITSKLAIVSDGPGTSSQAGEPSNGGVAIWDTSDPASPRLIQKFSKVVKWLQDDREFIYVLADDGLWIVSQPADLPFTPADPPAYGG